MTYTAGRLQTGTCIPAICIPAIWGRNLNVDLKVMPGKP